LHVERQALRVAFEHRESSVAGQLERRPSSVTRHASSVERPASTVPRRTPGVKCRVSSGDGRETINSVERYISSVAHISSVVRTSR
jgi:hypothetical protein